MPLCAVKHHISAAFLFVKPIIQLQWRRLPLHERHGVAIDRPLDVLIENLFKISTKKSPKLRITGPRLNIKTVLSAYGDFHVKDKTAVRTSYL